jgi:hypothetical protein
VLTTQVAGDTVTDLSEVERLGDVIRRAPAQAFLALRLVGAGG